MSSISTSFHRSSVVQAIGLACVPVADMGGEGKALARKPVAAAIIRLGEERGGRRNLCVTVCNDARDMEFPLPVLVNEALDPDAAKILSRTDMATLAIDAASRRFFVEGHLAQLATGTSLVDPGALFGDRMSEVALCRRLSIPRTLLGERDVALAGIRNVSQAAEDMAVSIAVARLMLWAHAEAFITGVPDPLFETLLPLRDWMLQEESRFPCLAPVLRSRPINRVSSFAAHYADYRARREAGDETARWVTFEDGLFHM